MNRTAYLFGVITSLNAGVRFAEGDFFIDGEELSEEEWKEYRGFRKVAIFGKSMWISSEGELEWPSK
jgi:hypothetical protein